jgi:hypothetical protein
MRRSSRRNSKVRRTPPKRPKPRTCPRRRRTKKLGSSISAPKPSLRSNLKSFKRQNSPNRSKIRCSARYVYSHSLCYSISVFVLTCLLSIPNYLQAEMDYKSAIDKLHETNAKFYRELGEIMQRIEELDRKRLAFVKSIMSNYSNLHLTCA